MAKVELIMMGCPVTTDRVMLGIPTVVLIRGRYNTLYDVGYYGTRHQILAELQSKGLSPGDVQRVILSHLHWDHALYLAPFMKSEIIVSSREFAQASDDKTRDAGTPPFMTQMLSACNLRLVEGTEEIDEGVRLIETPGHTAGFLAARVEDGAEVHVIAGDAIPHARFLATGHERGWFDQELADRGMRKLAAMGGIIYPAHDRPFRYDIDTGKVTYLQPYAITITCRFQASGEETTLRVSS